MPSSNVDYSAAYSDTIKKTTSEFEPVSADVSNERLGDELVAVRFEVFALALIHSRIRVGNQSKHRYKAVSR